MGALTGEVARSQPGLGVALGQPAELLLLGEELKLWLVCRAAAQIYR